MNSRHLVPREPYMPECHAEQAVSDFACVIQAPKPLSCGLRRFPHHKSGWVRVSRERTRSLCPGCRSIRGATAMRRSCCYPPDSSMNVFGQTVRLVCSALARNGGCRGVWNAAPRNSHQFPRPLPYLSNRCEYRSILTVMTECPKRS